MNETPERQAPEHVRAIEALLESFAQAASRNADVRNALNHLGAWLVAVTQECGASTEAHAPAPAAAVTPENKTDGRAQTPPKPTVPATLRLGDAAATVAVPQESRSVYLPRTIEGPRLVRAANETAALERAEAPPDLSHVVRRASLKRECCLWAAERRSRLAAGAEFADLIRPRDQELLAQSRQMRDCYVWPLDPYADLPSDELLERAALCYQNLARAAEYVQSVRAARDEEAQVEQAYALLAEAQSALRALTRQLDLKDDVDQYEAFRWLRQRTEEDQVYVPRHMRLSDAADPANASDLQQRLEEASDAWNARRQAEERRERLMNRARFHARKLVGRAGEDNGGGDWQRLHDAIVELIDGGLKPSNVELREMLLPLVDAIPDQLGNDGRFQRVLQELDRYVASREVDRPTATGETLGDNVRQVREMLRGRVVLLIGGECRRETADRLERTFELAELRWINTREHESTSNFEAAVARAETALVVLAIRWSSHSYEEVADMCVRYGKPFVRLPSGYGANQLAYQVLQQASESLRGQ